MPKETKKLNLNLPTYDLYLGIGWVYRYLEKLAEWYYLKRGLQVGIIRTANIYGPYDRFDETKSHVIPSLIKRAINKENPFIVWGNKETVRDFVFSDDLSYALLQVLENYCNGKPINFSLSKEVIQPKPASRGLIVSSISFPYRQYDISNRKISLAANPAGWAPTLISSSHIVMTASLLA